MGYGMGALQIVIDELKSEWISFDMDEIPV